MPLTDFINAHKGETAWIFGKGPSFSSYDFSQAGPLRTAINDVALHVPDCKYCFSNDGVERWADVYKEGQTLFQPKRCLGEWDSTKDGAVACEVVTYRDDYDDDRLFWPRDKLAECLSIRRGTLGSAIQILHIMGVKTIHLVGIDGGNVHAPNYKWRTKLRHEHWKDYNAIRDGAIDAGELLGIKLKFHNHKNTMTNDGKEYIKITRNCFAERKPLVKGEIVSVKQGIATALINCNSAIRHDGPASKSEIPEPDRKQIETATNPLDGKEAATIKTKKAKKGKK